MRERVLIWWVGWLVSMWIAFAFAFGYGVPWGCQLGWGGSFNLVCALLWWTLLCVLYDGVIENVVGRGPRASLCVGKFVNKLFREVVRMRSSQLDVILA